MSVLAGKNIVLGVTGGIAAYKAAEVCRLLVKAGATVRVVMTRAAREFITPLTLQSLSGHPVACDMFDLGQESQIGHIHLADDADLVAIVPATANTLARLATGLGDDLLAALVLVTKAPILLAPAMNVNMWRNPVVQANLAKLREMSRVMTVGPFAGELACGWVGEGRLADPTAIVAAIEARLVSALEERDLLGLRVVVTAGPTFEPIDDVRFLGNRSSGKMGFALAESAAARGADVMLVAGPVGLSTPPGVVKRFDVETAIEMQEAMQNAVKEADVVVMTAAVADFRPAKRVAGKISRQSGEQVTLDLVPNPDLAAELGRSRTGSKPYLIGFAAEVETDQKAIIERARAKLIEKRLDLVVANGVGRPGLGFACDHNAVTLVFSGGRTVPLGPDTKSAIARAIWQEVGRLDGFRR